MAEFIFVQTKTFFDKPRIVAAMDEKTLKVLRITGGQCRKAMQHGMRYRKKPSAPGDYPSAHKPNALLRQRIHFGFDEESRSLIIGPDKLNRTDREVAAAGKTVPQLVNEGGTILRKRTFDKKKKRWRHTNRARRQHYRERPFVNLTTDYGAERLAKNMENIAFK